MKTIALLASRITQCAFIKHVRSKAGFSLAAVLLLSLLEGVAQEPRYKLISEEQTEYFLSKSVGAYIPNFCKTQTGEYTTHGVKYYVNANGTQDQEVLSGRMMMRYNDMLRVIQKIQPKMVHTIGMWGLPDDTWGYFLQRSRATAVDIKNIDNDIIVGGSPNEYVDQDMLNKVGNIPHWVFVAFNLPPQNRQFDLVAMSWNDYNTWPTPSGFFNEHYWDNDANKIVPNIRNLEAQMWFYFLGRSYIDAGCESLNFCQVELMNGKANLNKVPQHYKPDFLNPFWWNIVFDKLRDYAETRADIRFLLITGHTHGMRDDAGRLAFDYHSAPIRPLEDLQSYSTIMPVPNNGGSCQVGHGGCDDIFEGSMGGIKPTGEGSMGGITPSGWKCAHAPAMTWLDNFGHDDPAVIGLPSNSCWRPYHYDEISWFGGTHESYRNDWLKYAYYKVRCLDKDVFMSLTLNASFNPNPNINNSYSANNPNPQFFPAVPQDANGTPDFTLYNQPFYAYGQEDAIADIFSQVNNSPTEWTYHNFAREDLLLQDPKNYVDNASNNLVFVGTDKIFYVADDGTIHGFIWENNAWVTVSPTYATSTPPASQVKCRGRLVASPDGSFLLYTGTDGYIHGFTINNSWSYGYFDFYMQDLISQNLKAFDDIIFPANDKVYYIATEANGDRRLHGFWKDTNGVWHTFSPTHSANVFHNQVLSSQAQASRGLAFDDANDRLYYIGTDDYIYYYEEVNNSGWDYTYHSDPKNIMTSQGLHASSANLAINGKFIYYAAIESTGKRWIHAIVYQNGQFGSVSPTHAANYYQVSLSFQTEAIDRAVIAVSPDGKYIAYRGSDGKPYYYKSINGVDYTFNKVGGIPSGVSCANSLQFTDNQTFYYISRRTAANGNFAGLHYHKLEPCHCRNFHRGFFEASYLYKTLPEDNDARISNDSDSTTAAVQSEHGINFPTYTREIGGPGKELKIYPNPVTKSLHIEVANVGNYHIKILSVLGIEVYSGELNGDLHKVIALDETLPAGTYILHITGEGLKHRKTINIVK
jgi:hypothetical protein